jgi:hypothetical protein
MTESTTLSPHRVELEISNGGIVKGRMLCDAPEGAPCRMHCGICEDYWEDDHDTHEQHDQGYCLRVEGWWDDPTSVLDGYGGTTELIRSGPVMFEWDGDGYTWEYAR